MREIKCEDITKTVKQLCMEAACNLPSDVFKALKDKTRRNVRKRKNIKQKGGIIAEKENQ